MSEDTLLPFDLPSVARKKLSIGFDGGQLSSNAGVILLRGVDAPSDGSAYAACGGVVIAIGAVEKGELVPGRVFNLPF